MKLRKIFPLLASLSDFELEQALVNDLSHHSLMIFDNQCVFTRWLVQVLSRNNIDFKLTSSLNPQGHAGLFIFPYFEFRIFNIHFYRTLNKQYGKPYYVGIIDSSLDLLEEKYSTDQTRTVFNLFTACPSFFKAYLTSQKLQRWLETSNGQPHNDSFDRTLLSEENLYEHKISISALKSQVLDQTKEHYPLHRVYEKYLHIKLNINLDAQRFYGTCC